MDHKHVHGLRDSKAISSFWSLSLSASWSMHDQGSAFSRILQPQSLLAVDNWQLTISLSSYGGRSWRGELHTLQARFWKPWEGPVHGGYGCRFHFSGDKCQVLASGLVTSASATFFWKTYRGIGQNQVVSVAAGRMPPRARRHMWKRLKAHGVCVLCASMCLVEVSKAPARKRWRQLWLNMRLCGKSYLVE